MTENNVEWWKDRPKDSMDYLFCLGPKHVQWNSVEMSIPEATKLVSLPYDWAEFGVFGGRSARLLLKELPSNTNLYLFDSFEGLPEDWELSDGIERKKGKYALKDEQIPKFDDERAILKIGWFEDTVPVFVEEHPEALSLIHIDCDVYSSTICVLDNLNNIIVPETVIVFDELYNYPDSLKNEYRALQEFRYKFNREFEYHGRTDKYAAWIKIIK